MIEQMSEVTLTLLLTGLAIGALVPLLPSQGRGRGAQSRRTRIIAGGVGLGLVASAVLSVVNTMWPKAVNRQTVGLWTLPMVIVCAVIVLVLVARHSRRDDDAPACREDAILRWVAFAYFALVIFRSVPTAMAQVVMLFPTGFELFSTPMVMALLGYTLGWVIVGALAWVSAKLIALRRSLTRSIWPTVLIVGVLALTHLLLIVRILQARRTIVLSKDVFNVIAWFINHEAVFPLAAMAVLAFVAVSIVVATRSIPTQAVNPAQGRLNRARVKLWKTLAGGAAAGYLCGALLVTLGVAIGSAQVELSEPEDYSVSNDKAVIALADVSDGHLHRFAYTTKSGVEVRFIVIQKAGSSFGVALDACEICGPTGYYEKDGKVICKLCEVAMNIATIGFKGGCNPIPIDYDVSNGQLTVPLSVLESSAEVFA
nr:DUF2318 domain-containing protein [Schaalia sp. ZJ1691]